MTRLSFDIETLALDPDDAKGGLHPLTGAIIVYSICDEDGPEAYYDGDEVALLQRATIALLGRPLYTWNGRGFDLPFLWKRAMVLGVRPTWSLPRNPKPWSELCQDTMLLWDSQQRAGGSMDRICRLLGIPGKDGMSGADEWPSVEAGRIDEVAAYCRGDVERTRAMFKRMTFSASNAAELHPADTRAAA